MCDETLNYHQWLQKGEQHHTEGVHYECTQCVKAFRFLSSFQTLERSPREKLYECIDCGKSYFTSASLQGPENLNSAENQYECKECGKAFLYHIPFKVRMERHTGDRLYHCETCGILYLYYSVLKQYKMSHTGEESYEYNQCGRSLSVSKHSQHNLKSHNAGKPFKCTVCDTDFKHYSSFQLHKFMLERNFKNARNVRIPLFLKPLITYESAHWISTL